MHEEGFNVVLINALAEGESARKVVAGPLSRQQAQVELARHLGDNMPGHVYAIVPIEVARENPDQYFNQ